MYELEKSGNGFSRWSLYKSRDALLALALIERAPATHLARKPYRLTQRGKEVVILFDDAFTRLNSILESGHCK
ncbi:MAG: hypothetical protein V1934_03970 [Methanobacteriota archaeon]